jgi:serine/threonine protein kinase/Flp pilus assembly protein TadD
LTTWNPRANELFVKALELPSDGERREYLDGACAGDAALRAEVEFLLEASARAGGFLESPASASLLVATVVEPIREGPGTVIGPYKLLEQIGEGGFGVVFLAEQQTPIRRMLALKVLKPGMDNKQVVARFEAERQALALMDHPNIAKILDAGQTSGRPYFVMDLVKGVPITAYCDQARLTPRERLELFVHVCQAVQHAHLKGIIHRDLKPSNVLVTRQDGGPLAKVIDFGIAKALGQQLTDKTLFTGFAQLIGTPLYMSPEQAALSDVDVDTRSDIYSLGVLLYELLTGTTPFDKERFKDVGYDELRRIIREEEPPKPSTRISTLGQAAPTVSALRQSDPKRLSQALRGELDWVVMKALEKDRTRRYESAGAFGADVQRYLNGEPVTASPPSARYRFGKFARRHKGRLAAAGLLLLALVGVGGGVGWVARDRAARQAILAEGVARALDEARAFCRRDRLADASSSVKRAEELLAGGEGGEELPERVGRARADVAMAALLEEIRLAKAEVEDGHFDFAGADRRYRDAFQSYGLDVFALDPDQAAARIRDSAIPGQLVAALDDWLVAKQGAGLRGGERVLAAAQRADGDTWRNPLREAFGRRDKKALKDLAGNPNVLNQPPATVVLLGTALRRMGENPLAITVLLSAQQQRTNDFWINHDLASALMKSRPVLAGQAVGYYRVALALRPDSPGVHFHLGIALRAQGDLAGAIAACQKAITLNPKFAEAHTSLGHALDAQGDHAGAAAAHRQALALKPNYAGAHNGLGSTLYAQGDWAGAAAAFRQALALKVDFAEAHYNLGNALRKQGDLAGATTAYRQAVAHQPDLVEPHYNLGLALVAQGDHAGAAAAFRQAIALQPDHAEAHNNLGLELRAQGDLAGAAAAFRQAIALKPGLAQPHFNLGLVLRAQGDLAGAAAAYRLATALEPDHAESHCNLGHALLAQGEFRQGLAALRRGHELGSKDSRWPYPSAQWVRHGERLIELDGQLPGFLEGTKAPASAGVRIELTQLCAIKQLHGAAARFFEEAFADRPNLLTAHRYNAACAAALAGCGRGEDAAKIDDGERARLRTQALRWLRDELTRWTKQLAANPKALRQRLGRWQRDPNLAGVRAPESLAGLPRAERKDWQKLWDNVADTLARAQGKTTPEKKTDAR